MSIIRNDSYSINTSTKDLLNKEEINLIKGFKNSLINNAMALSTSQEYENEIIRFFVWKHTKHNNKNIVLNREDILEYKNYVKEELSNTAETINRKIASLRNFNEYLIEQGIMDKLIILNNDYISIQVKYANPSTISEDEINVYLEEVKQNESKRNYAISCILVYCGLRISECLGLEQEFVDLDNKQLTIRNGKGNKQRIVYMNTKVVNAIKDYIDNERNSNGYKQYHNSKYLFISRQSNKLTTQSISPWMKKYGKKLHPHLMRHYCATNELRKGFDISEVMNQLGHSNIQTTMRYTNPTIEEMKAKTERL